MLLTGFTYETYEGKDLTFDETSSKFHHKISYLFYDRRNRAIFDMTIKPRELENQLNILYDL